MPDLSRRIARLRVPLGFIFAIFVLWFARPTGSSLAWGGAVAMVGEALRIWAAGHLNKSREVTSSGPYRWFGHPLYAGSAIMGVGLVIAANNTVVALIIAAYLAVTIPAAVRSEETFLRQTFGDRYERYRRGAADGGAAAARRFSLAQAIANREHRALAGLTIAVLLLVLKATYNGLFGGTGAGHQ